MKVNEAPTAKELAAAKAARIRLGYEKGDLLIEQVQEYRSLSKGNACLQVDAAASKCPSGTEPVAIEVDYTPTEKLTPLEDVEETLKVRQDVCWVSNEVGVEYRDPVGDKGLARDVQISELCETVSGASPNKMPPPIVCPEIREFGFVWGGL